MRIDLTREQLFQLVSHFEQMAGTLFLYSGDRGRSYLALFPTKIIHIQGGDRPWEALQELLPPFSGAALPEWLGFINYEMGAYSDPGQTIVTPYPAEAYFQKSAVLLCFDPQKGQGEIWIDADADVEKGWLKRLSTQAEWLNLAGNGLKTASKPAGPCRPLESKAQYLAKIEEIKREIASGNVYQVNLSQAFRVENFTDPYPFFCKLMEINPVSFAAFLRLEGRAIICASPERLLALKEGMLETNPIKGTMPRGASFEEDEKNKALLLDSEKNRAELLMIVDLMRNDLGKISLPGTIRTPHLCQLNTYPHLHHTQATIQSVPAPGLSPLNMLRTCFPGGSISGCPKLSAQQMIAGLEKRARKSYTGAIGYFCGNGDFDWNIAIRTVEVQNGEALVQLGGAIVYDSDPEQEYQETLVKGKTLFEAMGIRSL